MNYIQADLSRFNKRKTCWIEYKKGVKEGRRVELLPNHEKWKVNKLYTENIQTLEYLQKKVKMNEDFGKSIR